MIKYLFLDICGRLKSRHVNPFEQNTFGYVSAAIGGVEESSNNSRSKALLRIRARLFQFINSSASWCIRLVETYLKRWIALSRQSASPFYQQYIEAMLAEFAVMQREWKQEGYSDFEILICLLPSGFDFVAGVIRFAWARMMRTVSTLFYGFEQLLLLKRPVDAMVTMHDAPGLMILALRGLHQMTGSAGRWSCHVLLRLSPTTAVTGWDHHAEALFGFSQDEIIGRQAVETFVPTIETGGRWLPELLLKVCTVPHQYNLNFNENQDKQGNRFWMLWINVPQYNLNGELIETVSLGIQVQDPELMQTLVRFCQSFSR